MLTNTKSWVGYLIGFACVLIWRSLSHKPITVSDRMLTSAWTIWWLVEDIFSISLISLNLLIILCFQFIDLVYYLHARNKCQFACKNVFVSFLSELFIQFWRSFFFLKCSELNVEEVMEKFPITICYGLWERICHRPHLHNQFIWRTLSDSVPMTSYLLSLTDFWNLW